MAGIERRCQFEIERNPSGVADRFVERVSDNPLVVNATGMGKDILGSPLSNNCRFPFGSTLWDFNYRGERQFLEDARPVIEQFGLTLVDGWHYFICGWYQVMTLVFGSNRNETLLIAFECAAEDRM